MFIKNKNNNEQGIGLVEVIAALGISVVVLTALVSLALFTLRSSLQSKLALEGSKLANRELELLRAFRDGATNWETDFFDVVAVCTVGTPCHMEITSNSIGVDDTGADTTNAGSADEITRYFYVTTSGGTEVRVNVVVTWNIAGEPKYARLYTDLTNWKNN